MGLIPAFLIFLVGMAQDKKSSYSDKWEATFFLVLGIGIQEVSGRLI